MTEPAMTPAAIYQRTKRAAQAAAPPGAALAALIEKRADLADLPMCGARVWAGAVEGA